MATHASRDTTTGLKFEKMADFTRTDGEKIQQRAFASWVKKHGGTMLPWEFRPYNAFYFADTNEFVIYELKRQSTKGSADEKLAACGWRLEDYRTILSTVGIPPEKVKLIYIFENEWFRTPRYKTILNYMERQGCEYFFWDIDDDKKKRLMNYRYGD